MRKKGKTLGKINLGRIRDGSGPAKERPLVCPAEPGLCGSTEPNLTQEQLQDLCPSAGIILFATQALHTIPHSRFTQ